MTARRAVVTGGASGIGRAAALRLAQDGVRVTTLDLSSQADLLKIPLSWIPSHLSFSRYSQIFTSSSGTN